MADLAKPQKTAGSTKLLGIIILILIPNFVFILYLVNLINQSESFALEKFEELRNAAYIIYTGAIFIWGFFIMIGRQSNLTSGIPSLIILSLLLTTFSYALAKNALNLINLFNLF